MYRVERTRLHPFCTTPNCDRTMCYLFHVQQHHRSSSASPPQRWRSHSSDSKDASNEACCSSQSAPVSYNRETSNDSSRRDGNSIAAKPTTNERSLGSSRQNTSTVTLDDIIASARRKVSSDYMEPPLPQDIFAAVCNGNHSYAERESTVLSGTPRSTVNEVTRIQDLLAEESSFARRLLDSDSDTFISCEPPSLGTEDDLDHIVRAARPADIHSNPIMYPADPLFSTARKNHLIDRELSLDFSDVDLSAPNHISLTPPNDTIMSSKRQEAEFLGSL